MKTLNAKLASDRYSPDAKLGIQTELRRVVYLTRELEKTRRIFLYKNKRFPSGLLPRFLDYLYAEKIDVEVIDKRKKPKTNQIKLLTQQPLPQLRYCQKDAVKLAVSEGRGILVMPTGVGKTITSVKIVWELGLPTLFIAPNKGISEMMFDTMVEFFGKGKVEKITSKSKVTKKPIGICNIQGLVKVPPSALKQFQVVVIDEFHHTAAATYQEVNEKHLSDIYYRIGLTATNFRNDGADLALEAVLSEVLYEYSVKQAFDDGFLVRPKFHILPLSFPTQGKYQDVYREGIVENVQRNQIIAELAKEHSKDSVIILVQQVEHGETLQALIPGSVFIHGQEKDVVRQKAMKDFRKGILKCIIGTSVIGEGVDLPIANVLIMAGGGKARSGVIQNVGRVLRLFPGKTDALIYDFTDQDGSFLEEHSILRRHVYAGY
jgi:superfamily II DNA or RNA helicase